MKSLGFSQFLKQSIPGTIFAIGVSSLLINLSTSVIQSGVAVYLKIVLGVAVSTIGLIEAIVECVANTIKIFSGVISDYLRKRKLLMVVGFVLLTISKPLMAISKGIVSIFVARTIDRIGNGIQASPRDALISDSAPTELKGACYGLRQSLAVIGSTLGGMFGMLVMKLSNDNFQFLFLLATIPAVLATLILVFFVKEKPIDGCKSSKRKIRLHDIKSLGKRFWLLMIVVAVFMLARFGEFFISLHACENLNMKKTHIFIITIIFNLFTTLSAFPTGKLSDRVNRIKLLCFGFAVLFCADLCIGYANHVLWIFLGAAFWGIQRGIVDSMFAILVSSFSPKEFRGTGFGVYYIVVSISTFCATTFSGLIAAQFGESVSFCAGAGLCVVSILMLSLLSRTLNSF